MLNRVSFIVLLSSGSEEVIRPCKPIEHINISFSRTYEKHIFSEIILDHNGFRFPFTEDFKKLQIHFLASKIKGRPAFEIWNHAELSFLIIDLLRKIEVLFFASQVESSPSGHGYFRAEVNIFMVLINENIKHILPIVLNTEVNWTLAVYVS